MRNDDIASARFGGLEQPPGDAMLRAGFILLGVFWLGYFGHASAHMAVIPKPPTVDLTPRRILAIAVGLSLTSLAHILVTYVAGGFARRAVLTVVAGCVCCLAFALANAWIYYGPMSIDADITARAAFQVYVFQFAWVFATWSAAYIVLMAVMDLQQQRERAARAEAAAQRAHLDMLRYQLNPHFLFNTLNSISALVLDRRNADAEAVLLRLSRFLRHTIDNDSTQKSSLGAEVMIQREYLEIEQARFGDRLQVRCLVPSDLNDCMVPSLLIQPLVENALKHGAAKQSSVTTIEIGAETRGEKLVMWVEDDGPGIIEACRFQDGLGLRNIRDRLATLYGAAGEIRLSARQPKGLRVELRVPLERAA